jgi:hypothetical protein
VLKEDEYVCDVVSVLPHMKNLRMSMRANSELLKRAKNILNEYKKSHEQHVLFTGDETRLYTSDKPRIYKPSATGKLFHSDDTFVRLVMGPYNSGKSTMCVHEIVKRASAMPPWYNGRRKSRWAIVRNTSGELHSTTLQTWLNWFSDLGHIEKRQKPLLTYHHTFNDGDGLIELELIFIALDRDDDIRKIKSFEVTGVYLNELSEVPKAVLSHFKGRVNYRYPSRDFCGMPYYSGIIADTNPPDIDHWIFSAFEEQATNGHRIFRQPTGLSPIDETANEEEKATCKSSKGQLYIMNKACDNYEHMSPDYYLKLADGQTDDFVKVYCLGEYGTVATGKVVYPEYNPELHSVTESHAIQGLPICLVWDFGLTPACLAMQITPRGQLLVLKEYQGEDIGIRSFAESIVLPAIERDFPYNTIGLSIADPAGAIRDQIYEELSCIGELNNLGIPTIAARTNDIEPRLQAVRYFLTRLVDGKPSIIISRTGCPILHKGFIRDYYYKRISVASDERYRDVPHKNFASHLHDCLQYGALQYASEAISKEKFNQPKVDMYNPGFMGLRG